MNLIFKETRSTILGEMMVYGKVFKASLDDCTPQIIINHVKELWKHNKDINYYYVVHEFMEDFICCIKIVDLEDSIRVIYESNDEKLIEVLPIDTMVILARTPEYSPTRPKKQFYIETYKDLFSDKAKNADHLLDEISKLWYENNELRCLYLIYEDGSDLGWVDIEISNINMYIILVVHDIQVCQKIYPLKNHKIDQSLAKHIAMLEYTSRQLELLNNTNDYVLTKIPDAYNQLKNSIIAFNNAVVTELEYKALNEVAPTSLEKFRDTNIKWLSAVNELVID